MTEKEKELRKQLRLLGLNPREQDAALRILAILKNMPEPERAEVIRQVKEKLVTPQNTA